MDQLVKSISIENLLAQRDGVVDRINQAHALLLEASEIATAAGITNDARYFDFGRIIGGPDYSHHQCNLLRPEDVRSIVSRVDAGAWNHLMHESGLLTFMDRKAREDWAERIHKCGETITTEDGQKFIPLAPLTYDNIEATFKTLHGARMDMFDRGVIQCFKRLSWDYKTNQPFKFGKRLVITYLRNKIVSGTGDSLGHPNHRICDELDDLVRVLSKLDGKPEPDHRQGMYSKLHQGDKRGDIVDTDYFTIAQFRNGNGHITFKRPELVEKMNRILAKHFPGALAHDQHADEKVAA